MYVVGIDIGGTKTTFMHFYYDKKLSLIKKEKLITRDYDFPSLFSLIEDKTREADAIGFSLPGIIHNGKLYNAPNNEQLEGKNIEKAFRKLGKKFIIENDASCFLYAELKEGRAKGKKGVIAGWIFGTGIGGALALVDKETILMKNIEFGHQVIPFNKRIAKRSEKAKQTFSSLGAFTLESIASGKTREELGKSYDLFENEIKEAVSYAFYNVSVSFNASLHIVGGGYAKFLGKSYFKEIERKVNSLYTRETGLKKNIKIELFKISEDSGAYGAALLAINRFLKSRKNQRK